MKGGLFRTIDIFLGECARVHEDAGDAAPYLRRELYELLGMVPAYDELPLIARDMKDPVIARIASGSGSGAD